MIGRISLTPHSPTELKHLSFLDGRALLMVMDDNSDVVAVANGFESHHLLLS